MFQASKKDEFEEKLEAIRIRVKERRRVEEKLKDFENRIVQIEEKVSQIEIPKEIQREFVELRNQVKNFEEKVWSELDKTQKEFANLKNEINVRIVERMKESLSAILEERLKEREKELKAKIEQIENKINKLVEVLEVMG
jgi:DNA repair exonuclease SbcCD ATPase subunit